MSTTAVTPKEETPSIEFRDSIIGLINDQQIRNDIARLAGGKFIEELSRQCRREGQLYKHRIDNSFLRSINMDEKTRRAYDRMCLIAESAKSSIYNCEHYARSAEISYRNA